MPAISCGLPDVLRVGADQHGLALIAVAGEMDRVRRHPDVIASFFVDERLPPLSRRHAASVVAEHIHPAGGTAEPAEGCISAVF